MFEVAKGSWAITTLASFTSDNGSYPQGGLVEDSSGNLFGTTYDDGLSGDGTVFELAAGSGTITTLASFSGTNGDQPHGSLIEDNSGNLFGTTAQGGTYGDGTVFEVATTGSPAVASSTASLPVNAAILTIAGVGFDTNPANDSVTFNDGVTGTVTAATTTSLTVSVTGLSSLTVGNALQASVTVDGTSSGNPVQVATIAPVVTSSMTSLPVNAASLTIAGLGFDTNPANDSVTFSGGVTGTVTAATTTSLTVSVTGLSNLTAGNALQASVTVDGTSSGNPVQVATLAPVVTSSTDSVPVNAASLTIAGLGFDTNPANDSVTFSSGVTGTVIAATTTSLTVSVSGLSSLTVGTILQTSVTVDGSNSGNPVQVATLAPVVSVTSSTASVAGNASSLTIAGLGFDTNPANDSVTFSNGVTGTVTAATTTSLTVSVSGLSSLTAGTALQASVIVDGTSSGSAVQVATIAPVVTPKSAWVSAHSTSLTIVGSGFDTNPAKDIVTFSGGVTGTVTSATATQLTVSKLGGLSKGVLNASVTVDSVSSGSAVQVATVAVSPVFTSPTSATFTVGQNNSLTITTTAYPTATLSEQGTLPSGVTFVNNGNGTATLSGKPVSSTGRFTITITANNQYTPAVNQSVTLTVVDPPTFLSSHSTTFVVGQAGSFTITTKAGLPTATTLTEKGTLPAGVSFKDNGNGTATLKGTPAAGKDGTYALTFTASNGTAPNATQSFTLTVDQAPALTSAAPPIFVVGQAGSFTVTTSGFPTPTLTLSGTLPAGLSFKDNGNGTATLSGTPAAGSKGNYALTVIAGNGVGVAVKQSFTLTVGQPPSIASASSATFTVGQAGSFTITTTAGLPAAITLTEKGALPSGVTFTDNKNGTATLKGTPAAGKGGTYALTFTASNGLASKATQSFTLTVDQAPALTSGKSATFVVGQAGSFTVYTNGFPKPTLTLTGTLPAGLSFTNNGNGTATLSGTPASGSQGTYALAFTAVNGVGAGAKQSFTLTVEQPPSIASAPSTTFTVGQAGSFTITTTPGLPVATTLAETGALPRGVSFTDNKNGTATLKGTPAASQGGNYALALTASNGVAPKATQSFTLTVDQAPALTSAATATFVLGQAGSFTVTTSGFPAATLSASTLPTGLSFTDNGNGTATLSGTLQAGSTASYTIGLTAGNGVGANATQKLTLLVDQAPLITSANNTTFTAGQAGSFEVTTSGNPVATLSVVSSLPTGLSLVDNHNGTATLQGTLSGPNQTYTFTICANNGLMPTAFQLFTLTVD